MQGWLRERGETVPEPTAHSCDAHHAHEMAGMATPEQMAELAAAEGTDFDRLFLTPDDRPSRGRGDDGRGTAGAAGLGLRSGAVRVYDDVTNDQTTEIERMNAMLVGLSDDPRAELAAGFTDAGQAIMNMRAGRCAAQAGRIFRPGESG